MGIVPDRVSGRYLGGSSTHLLVLRVDLAEDGLGLISGDLYERVGSRAGDAVPDEPDADEACRYLYSFISRLPARVVGPARAVDLDAPCAVIDHPDLHGRVHARLWPAAPGRPEFSGDAEVTVASHRRPHDVLTVRAPLAFAGSAFRRARLYVDRAIDRATRKPYELPLPYRVGSASPSPDLPPRDLGVVEAFADAGVDLQLTSGAIALPDSAYTRGLGDDELHGVLWNAAAREKPRGWWVHMLVAPRHATRGVLGILYDSRRAYPRHGVALFLDELRAHYEGPTLARETLFCAVHELGHAFNLLHSFQKGFFGGSDVPPRPAALSWMNYPHLYPHGWMVEADQTDRFWTAFRFRFDREELEHLRHHARDEVMMGVDDFGALGDYLGPVRARLEVQATAEFGEPFSVAIVLENAAPVPLAIALPADPLDAITLSVRRPAGGWTRFAPLLSRLARPREVALAPGARRRLPFSAFYGRDGFTFADPGTYLLAATLNLPGMTPLRLPTTAVCVRPPPPGLESALVDGVYGDEQGHFLSFFGGDHLVRGRTALEGVALDPRLAGTHVAMRVKSVLAAAYARGYQFAAPAGRTPRERPPRPEPRRQAARPRRAQRPARARRGAAHARHPRARARRGGPMTTVLPNRSIVEGTVEEVTGGVAKVLVSATRKAWPYAADLASHHLDETLEVRLPSGTALAVGDKVELECSLSPVEALDLAWVAVRAQKR